MASVSVDKSLGTLNVGEESKKELGSTSEEIEVEKRSQKRKLRKSSTVGLRKLNSSLAKSKNVGMKSVSLNPVMDEFVARIFESRDEAEFKSAFQFLAESVSKPNVKVWFQLFDGVYVRLQDKSRNMTQFMKSKKPYDIVLSMFRTFQEQPYYRHSTDTYAKMIALMGWSRKPDLSWSLMMEMQANGCQLTTTVCNALLRSLLLSNCMEEANEVLKRMTESSNCRPNLRTYNIFLESLCTQGKVARSEPYLKKIQELGKEGDEFTFSSLLDGFCRTGNKEAVQAVLKIVVQRNFNVKPVVMVQLVTFLGKIQDWEGLRTALTLCTAHSYKPTSRVLSTFMWAFSLGSTTEELLASLRELDQRGFALRSRSFFSMFLGLSKADNPAMYAEEIRSLWTRLKKTSFPPNPVLSRVYAKAMTCLYKIEAYDLMTEAYYTSLEAGCAPSMLTSSTLICGFAHGGFIHEMELAFEMLRQVSSINAYVQEEMVAAYLRHGEEDKAELIRMSTHWFSSRDSTEDVKDETLSDADDLVEE